MVEKRHELSDFDCGRVIGVHDAGMSIRKIEDMSTISKTTMQRIIKEFEDEVLTEARPRSGRPQQLDIQSKRHLIQIVEKDHFTPLDQITT